MEGGNSEEVSGGNKGGKKQMEQMEITNGKHVKHGKKEDKGVWRQKRESDQVAGIDQ